MDKEKEGVRSVGPKKGLDGLRFERWDGSMSVWRKLDQTGAELENQVVLSKEEYFKMRKK